MIAIISQFNVHFNLIKLKCCNNCCCFELYYNNWRDHPQLRKRESMKCVKVGLSANQRTLMEGLHSPRATPAMKKWIEEKYLTSLVYFFIEENQLNKLKNVNHLTNKTNFIKLEIDGCIADFYKSKKAILNQSGFKMPAFTFFIRKLINHQLTALLNNPPEETKDFFMQLVRRYRPDMSFTEEGRFVEIPYMIHPNPKFFDPK